MSNVTEPIYPIEISFEDYVGPFTIVNRTHGVVHHGRVQRWIPGDVLNTLSGGYTLHRVVYSPHPAKHSQIINKRGEAVMTCVHGSNVGGAREHFVWVHAEHRNAKTGLHLASEMGVAWFKLGRQLGFDWRLTPESRAAHRSDNLTPAGLRFRTMQYKLMVEREILSLPEGCQMPEFVSANAPRQRRHGRWSS